MLYDTHSYTKMQTLIFVETGSNLNCCIFVVLQKSVARKKSTRIQQTFEQSTEKKSVRRF